MKLCILGHFDGDKPAADGQTIKTRILYGALSRSSIGKIHKIDTSLMKTNPFKLFFQSLFALFLYTDIIFLVSTNGRKFYFPFFYYAKKIFKINIYHNLIGGNLDSEVNVNHKWIGYISCFNVNWVESNLLKNNLEALGVTNAEVLYNFKKLNVIQSPLLKTSNKPFRFCIFSRIEKEKGIEIAIETINIINENQERNLVELDIYGKISKNYEESFLALSKTFPNTIQYKGIVDYSKSTEILKKYYMLLFPTYWPGEGMAGTVIDAFSAGIPVIASDWNSNSEFICDGKTGFLCEPKSIESLKEKILFCINNVNLVNEMSKNCIVEAKKNTEEAVVPQIIKKIQPN